jgi:aminomuconate-semialdehyde/2-hydroxymuconate-6-semialdehyde dehydrogenase
MNYKSKYTLPNQALHFIGGEYVESFSQKIFPNYHPATNEQIGTVALGGEQEIEAAVRAAQRAFTTWSKTPPANRSAILQRLADKILEEKAYLAWLETYDTGKPISETLNGDIPRSSQNFKFFADLILTQAAETFTNPDGSIHKATRQPLGVCGLITPWNLPLYLATWKIAPALAAGNTVVLKPAELTPLTASALCKIASEAGLPPGVLNVVHGFGENGAGQALVKHPAVTSISFTGETTTGKAIMKDAASTLKKISFELGGKGATVIFADADLDAACTTARLAGFRNQGQICLAGSRLIVEEKVAMEVKARLLGEIANIKVGDPFDDATTMGALISREHLEKVESYVEFARNNSQGKIECGGSRTFARSNGNYFEPTLISGVAQDSKLIQEEIFGPVLTMQTFTTKEQAAELLNGTKYGLSCSVFTTSPATQEFMAAEADFGIVWMNCWFVRHLGTPFGGTKQSGIGREGGEHSLDFFSEWKTVTYK